MNKNSREVILQAPFGVSPGDVSLSGVALGDVALSDVALGGFSLGGVSPGRVSARGVSLGVDCAAMVLPHRYRFVGPVGEAIRDATCRMTACATRQFRPRLLSGSRSRRWYD